MNFFALSLVKRSRLNFLLILVCLFFGATTTAQNGILFSEPDFGLVFNSARDAGGSSFSYYVNGDRGQSLQEKVFEFRMTKLPGTDDPDTPRYLLGAFDSNSDIGIPVVDMIDQSRFTNQNYKQPLSIFVEGQRPGQTSNIQFELKMNQLSMTHDFRSALYSNPAINKTSVPANYIKSVTEHRIKNQEHWRKFRTQNWPKFTRIYNIYPDSFVIGEMPEHPGIVIYSIEHNRIVTESIILTIAQRKIAGSNEFRSSQVTDKQVVTEVAVDRAGRLQFKYAEPGVDKSSATAYLSIDTPGADEYYPSRGDKVSFELWNLFYQGVLEYWSGSEIGLSTYDCGGALVKGRLQISSN